MCDKSDRVMIIIIVCEREHFFILKRETDRIKFLPSVLTLFIIVLQRLSENQLVLNRPVYETLPYLCVRQLASQTGCTPNNFNATANFFPVHQLFRYYLLLHLYKTICMYNKIK